MIKLEYRKGRQSGHPSHLTVHKKSFKRLVEDRLGNLFNTNGATTVQQ